MGMQAACRPQIVRLGVLTQPSESIGNQRGVDEAHEHRGQPLESTEDAPVALQAPEMERAELLSANGAIFVIKILTVKIRILFRYRCANPNAVFKQ